MRTTRAWIGSLLALATFGCDSNSHPAGQARAPEIAAGPALRKSSPSVRLEPVAWDPKSIEEGYMFRDFASFRRYVRDSVFIGRGVYTKREGLEVTVKINEVYHGRATTRELTVRADGGGIHPAPGDEVLVFSRIRDGRAVLNSFCAASGLYRYSDHKAALIRACLNQRG